MADAINTPSMPDLQPHSVMPAFTDEMIDRLAVGLIARGVTAAPAAPRGITTSLLAAAALSDHPDASLFQAWDQWLAAERAFEADPPEMLDDRLAHYDRQSAAAQAAEQIPACTPAGVAIKLRVALFYLDEDDGDIRHALVLDLPVDSGVVNTSHESRDILVRVLKDLERMAAA